MKKSTVRTVFIFFIIWLPLQYGLIGVISLYSSEPWPAFIFPGFKNVYVYDDNSYAITDLEFEICCRDDGPVRVAGTELFRGIPLSQAHGFLRANFGGEPAVTLEAETRLWLEEQLSNLHPQMRPVSMEAVWTESFYRGRNAEADSTAERQRIPLSFSN